MNKVTERAILDFICDDVLPAYGIASALGRNDPELADGVRAVLASAPVAVKVRELVWSPTTTGEWQPRYFTGDFRQHHATAQTPFDRPGYGYSIIRNDSRDWRGRDDFSAPWVLAYNHDKIGEYPSEDEAKVAAQAHLDRAILSAIEPQEGWRDMSSAPKDGTRILVAYNHNADPYQSPSDPDKLTDYAAWAEGGDFKDGEGICIAAWQPDHWESTDEYGSGYRMPAYWFAFENEDYERVVHPIGWMPLPTPPAGRAEG